MSYTPFSSEEKGWGWGKNKPFSMKFRAKLTPFKHTWLFPEQHLHRDWMTNLLQTKWHNKTRKPRVLNLFGYTWLASVACSLAGAEVTHVDASYPMITWTKDNEQLSNCPTFIRALPDDVNKFIERELRKGTTYDGIIMDPPVFGHGVRGEVWRFEDDFPRLLRQTKKLLSDTPLFVLINAYAITISSFTLHNILVDMTKNLAWSVSFGELVLTEQSAQRMLSTGIFARWETGEV